jgi:hypothetical protein
MAEDDIPEEETEEEVAAPELDEDGAVEDGEAGEADSAKPRTKRKSDDDDDDDDDEIDDDVEEDLDKILKDRLVAADDEEDEEDEPEPKGEGDERLLPKQQNEQLCSSCFLLVKSSAPNCPVGDDDCPIFS